MAIGAHAVGDDIEELLLLWTIVLAREHSDPARDVIGGAGSLLLAARDEAHHPADEGLPAGRLDIVVIYLVRRPSEEHALDVEPDLTAADLDLPGDVDR